MQTMPGSVSELTPEWLTDALAGSGSLGAARVTSVDSTTIGRGSGLMSQVARLRLTYDVDVASAPQSLIVKLPPSDSQVRTLGVQLGFFEREARFYSELAEQSAIRTPRCYFTRYDASRGAFLTLLEDLSDQRIGDIGIGCSVDEGIGAMQALGDLHAAWWNSPVLAGLSWLQTSRGALDQELAMFEEAWPSFESRFGDGLEPEQLRMLTSVHRRLTRTPDAVSDGPWSLLHGDYKLDNMFFDAGENVAMFDWGTIMTGPAAFDVAYFLALNLDPLPRRRHENKLLHAYLARLAAHGIEYDHDRCVADYRIHLVGFLPRLVCAGGLAEFADEQARLRYLGGLRRALAAVEDHRALAGC